MVEPEYCQFSLDIQDGSNIRDLVNSWNQYLQHWKLQDDPAKHPATYLIIDKLSEFVGHRGGLRAYCEAYDYVQDILKED